MLLYKKIVAHDFQYDPRISFKIPFIGNSSFSFLVPHTTCFGLAGNPQVCLIRFTAPPAMLWSASASGFGRGVFICNG
jgi:hypothetical protein